MTEASAEQTEQEAQQAALVEALLGVVEQLHGPLDDERREQLRGGLQRSRGAAAALYAYPLTNADEPTTIFRPFRAD